MGIAVAGIALVLWKMSFHDHVRVLDPATSTIQLLRVLNDAKDSDLEFAVVPAGGGPPVIVAHVTRCGGRPDRKSVPVRFADGTVRSVTLVARSNRATPPAPGGGSAQLFVDDPDRGGDRGLRAPFRRWPA